MLLEHNRCTAPRGPDHAFCGTSDFETPRPHRLPPASPDVLLDHNRCGPCLSYHLFGGKNGYGGTLQGGRRHLGPPGGSRKSLARNGLRSAAPDGRSWKRSGRRPRGRTPRRRSRPTPKVATRARRTTSGPLATWSWTTLPGSRRGWRRPSSGLPPRRAMATGGSNPASPVVGPLGPTLGVTLQAGPSRKDWHPFVTGSRGVLCHA